MHKVSCIDKEKMKTHKEVLVWVTLSLAAASLWAACTRHAKQPETWKLVTVKGVASVVRLTPMK